MKKLVLFLLCISAYAANAQDFRWSYSPADTTGGVSSSFEIVNGAYFVNNGDDTTFVWKRTSMLPTGWLNAVCDVNQCYGEDVDTAQFILAKGDSFKMKANFYPENNEGIGCISLDIINLSNRNEIVTRRFCASTILSTPKTNAHLAKVYPNPAQDEVFVKVENSTEFVVTVFDILGNKKYEAKSNKSIHALNVSNWNKGVYILNIESSGVVINKSFIKQQ